MPDPLREALEFYACREAWGPSDPDKGLPRVDLDEGAVARAALAASPAPVREWQVVNKNGGVVPGGTDQTEAMARSWLPDLEASFPDYAPYRVQRRDVFYGPWVNVPAEGDRGCDLCPSGPRDVIYDAHGRRARVRVWLGEPTLYEVSGPVVAIADDTFEVQLRDGERVTCVWEQVTRAELLPAEGGEG